jgi:hypothetical protein
MISASGNRTGKQESTPLSPPLFSDLHMREERLAF